MELCPLDACFRTPSAHSVQERSDVIRIVDAVVVVVAVIVVVELLEERDPRLSEQSLRMRTCIDGADD